ncbi:MAG: NAD(P)H-dependent glycerol-3-phosphate dehydrogenase, partial [Acidobacteriota bacterium]
LSRNRALGAALGRGKTLAQYQQSTPMIAEGVRTTASAHRLARREGISMPIVEQVHAVLYEDRPVGEAIRELLARPLTSEMSPGHGSTRRPPRH